jgi:hypothetical protein
MASLPNGEAATLDIRKLSDYCLDPVHPRGRHKARVFRETLGVLREDAVWLRNAILTALPDAQAVELETDEYGTRWRTDVSLMRHDRRAVIRTIWIFRAGEPVPRFVTCWVL